MRSVRFRPTRRVEAECVVDLWLGERSMELNFLNLQVLEVVLRSLRLFCVV